MDEDAWNRKHGRSTILGKYVFRLDLNESREGFCQRGRNSFFFFFFSFFFFLSFFRGNPLCQATKRHLNNSYTLKQQINDVFLS